MIEAVIFDCDGVLFDSLGANIAYYNAVLTALRRPLMDPDLERLAHRLSTRQFFEHVFSDDAEMITEARRVAQATDYEPFYKLMRPVPAIHSLLAGLRSSYRLAMATNRGFTAHEVARRFELDRYLELTVGILDVPRPKPYPDMLLRCTEHFAIAPQQAVYVGDAISDLEAARAADMHFIGLGTHLDTPHRVESVSQVPAVVAKLNL